MQQAATFNVLLKLNLSCTKANFGSFKLTQEQLEVIVEASHEAKWEVLDLSDCHLKSISALSNLNSDYLKVLSLQRNSISFVSSLKSFFPKLEELNLSFNPLKNTDFIQFVPFLNNSNLHTLNLASTSIEDPSILALCAVLPNTKLRKLQLNHTGITDKSLKTLAMKNNVIEELNLNHTLITNDGVVTLGKELSKRFSRLKKLYLSENRIGDEAVEIVYKNIVYTNSQLTLLQLNETLISDRAVGFILKSIGPSNLKEVSLKWNKISKESYLLVNERSLYFQSTEFSLILVILSVKAIPRLARNSNLSRLPSEMLRKVIEMLNTR